MYEKIKDKTVIVSIVVFTILFVVHALEAIIIRTD